MARVVFFTQAYNSEKTLPGTIESVLRQTYGDFIYYIYDNNSTDKTAHIMSEYAQRDGRIVATRKDTNNFHAYLDAVAGCCREHPDGFWAMLDADDEYKPDFLEKMLAFTHANNLDMSACGSDALDETTKQLISQRKIERDLFLSGAGFSDHFGHYHQFMRTIWGKLYSISLLRKCSFDKVMNVRYGADSIFAMETFRRSDRVGIMGETLHKYYISTKSVSHRWDPTRWETDHLLDYLTRGYLRDKCGVITPLNNKFLSIIHFNAIMDTLNVLLSAEMAFAEKIQIIKNIISHKKVQKLLAGNCAQDDDSYKKIRESVLNYVIYELDQILPLDKTPAAAGICNRDASVPGGCAITPESTRDNDNIFIHPARSKKQTAYNQNGCDVAFYELAKRIKTTGIDELLAEAVKSVSGYRSTDNEYYELLLKWYKNWYSVGSFDVGDRGFLNYFGSMYKYLQQHIEDLAWLYENLCDYRSKYQLKTVLLHWLTFKPDIREHGVEKTFAHYYDLDIIKCDENEVFVDCGAYDGDSIISFIEHYGGRYKSIYGYELTPSTFKKATDNLKKYERVFMRNAGVADKNGTMAFIDDCGDQGSGNRLMPNGNVLGRIVKLDDDIKEDVTFIKMDVEGAEIAALLGAQNHIRRSKPKLAISLYHKPTDLIEIPRLIKRLSPEYKLYFQHCPGQFPFPTEYSILAVIDPGFRS